MSNVKQIPGPGDPDNAVPQVAVVRTKPTRRGPFGLRGPAVADAPTYDDDEFAHVANPLPDHLSNEEAVLRVPGGTKDHGDRLLPGRMTEDGFVFNVFDLITILNSTPIKRY